MVPKTTRKTNDTPISVKLYLALELSQAEWKLGFTIGLGQAPRLRNLKARDLEGLKGEIEHAKERFGMPREAAVLSCYEAGRDGFWLHRALTELGIRNQVIDSASIPVDRKARRAKIDFTGTSPQRPNNFNAPSSVAKAAVLYVFRTMIDDEIPMNAGCLEPLDIVIPEGCMLRPTYPAAVVAGNVETSQCITDALYGAMKVMAAAQGTMNNFTFGNERYQYYETIGSGAGAGEGFDGASAVQTHMTNSRLTDPEVLEQRFPVLLDSFAIRRGSGGAGRWRGGDGVVRRLRFREPMTVSTLSE